MTLSLGPTELNGLPAHILLIHLVVVGIPLAALVTLLSVAWPPARRRLGVATPVIAAGALVLVPITTRAGEWLRDRLPATPLIERHAEMGDQLLPWAAGLFVISLAQWIWFRRRATAGSADGLDSGDSVTPATTGALRKRRGIEAALLVLALVVSIGSVVEVYRIGDSGAKAAWTGSFSPTPLRTGP